ncbi:MAG: hypothetical protein P1R58_02150 [bacterium]|nr:hypothetical protein [bacterium]
MKKNFAILTLLWILLLSFAGISFTKDQDQEFTDDNVAFYEGKSLDYVVYPPRGFKLIIDEAMGDGYSMAFIPDSQDYKNTSALISVNIFSNAGTRRSDLLDQFIVEDTAEMRDFYGDEILIRPVDSVLNFHNEILPTFFLDDKEDFLPHVMSSYYGSADSEEILTFELHIGESYPRFEAEKIFIDFLRQFKALKHGTLGDR